MKNPFEKLFGGGEAATDNRENKLAELRQRKTEVETGIRMDTEGQSRTQDQEVLDRIDKQIEELEGSH